MTGLTAVKKGLREFWHSYLVLVVYFVLAALLFRGAAGAARENTQLSLRYTDTPVTSQAASGAHDSLRDPDNQGEYAVAFWRQFEQMTFASETGATTAGAIYVDGDIAGVYPASFIYGAYPTPIDDDGIAVSEGFAWQMWGGGDLLGTKFEWDGRVYQLRGIFEGEAPMVLFQINSADFPELTYTGVELYGAPVGDPRTSAITFAQSLGLGTPNSVVSGPSMASLMMGMAMVPLLILGIWFVAKLMGQVRRLRFWPRQAVWFVFLLALAILIPMGLDLLPAWVVPNKWSDLDAWSAFALEMNTRIDEWLALYPSFRDVMLKRQLVVQAVLLVGCMFATTAAIRIWNRKLAPHKVAAPVEEIATSEEATPEEEHIPEEDDPTALLEEMRGGQEDVFNR